MEAGESTRLGHSELEAGRLLFERGDCIEALSRLKKATSQAQVAGSSLDLIESFNLRLRVGAELEDHLEIAEVTRLINLGLTNGDLELSGRTLYNLGLCSSYAGRDDEAQVHLEQAIKVALAQQNKRDICYAVHGLALVLAKQGKLEQAEQEIENLKVCLQVLNLPEVQIAALILEGYIKRARKDYELALKVFWEAYEKLKQQKVLTLYVSVLYAIGTTYLESGDDESARIYLDLARRAVDPNNLKHMSRQIDRAFSRLGAETKGDFDLVFKSEAHAVIERRKGRIDFRNQFVLLDMLKMFVKNPGQVHSKEDMVASIWKQQYDPAVHDNKIYVTIKRLRKMIEPEYEKPKYIFRAKNGYFLSKEAKVSLDD